MPWTAYILKSQKDNTLYKGSCEAFSERLASHNAGRVRSTKARRPWVKHYTEEFPSKAEALRRERFFKTRSGYRWLKQQGLICLLCAIVATATLAADPAARRGVINNHQGFLRW